MTDLPTFISYASTGDWSTDLELSLQGDVIGLDFGLKTYILSSALAGNKYRGAVAINFTPTMIMQNTGCTFSGDICTLTPEDLEWYVSTSTSRVYDFNAVNFNPDATQPRLMNDIESNGWTSLDLLFDGGWNCNVAGSQGGVPLNFDSNGNLDTSCMSQLQICIGSQDSCPTGLVNEQCPFIVCVNPDD